MVAGPTSTLQFDLGAKRAIVVGASRGVGAHIARTLISAGSQVVGMARTLEPLDAAKAACTHPDRFHPIITDITQASAVANAVEGAIEAIGSVDILVNAVSTTRPQRFLDINETTWEHTVNTNLSGVYRMSRRVATTMIEAGTKGSIVNVTSILASRAVEYQAGYSAAKAAVESLTRNMAYEMSRDGIRVNALELGYFATAANREYITTPQGERFVTHIVPQRLGTYHEIDGALGLLVSDAGSYITGTTITIDGGTSLPIR